MHSCSGVFGILVRWYLVGLVESVDAKVAESAKRLWLEEIPASGKVGRPSREDAGKDRLPTNRRDAEYYLAALKKKRPDLAQQVIDGELSATKAARAVGARIVRSEPRLKGRAIYDL